MNHLRIELFRVLYANDSMRVYRVKVNSKLTFYVTISDTAYTTSGGQPLGRIREWFLNNPLPPHGATLQLPGYWFDPRFI